MAAIAAGACVVLAPAGIALTVAGATYTIGGTALAVGGGAAGVVIGGGGTGAVMQNGRQTHVNEIYNDLTPLCERSNGATLPVLRANINTLDEKKPSCTVKQSKAIFNGVHRVLAEEHRAIKQENENNTNVALLTAKDKWAQTVRQKCAEILPTKNANINYLDASGLQTMVDELTKVYEEYTLDGVCPDDCLLIVQEAIDDVKQAKILAEFFAEGLAFAQEAYRNENNANCYDTMANRFSQQYGTIVRMPNLKPVLTSLAHKQGLACLAELRQIADLKAEFAQQRHDLTLAEPETWNARINQLQQQATESERIKDLYTTEITWIKEQLGEKAVQLIANIPSDAYSEEQLQLWLTWNIADDIKLRLRLAMVNNSVNSWIQTADEYVQQSMTDFNLEHLESLQASAQAKAHDNRDKPEVAQIYLGLVYEIEARHIFSAQMIPINQYLLTQENIRIYDESYIRLLDKANDNMTLEKIRIKSYSHNASNYLKTCISELEKRMAVNDSKKQERYARTVQVTLQKTQLDLQNVTQERDEIRQEHYHTTQNLYKKTEKLDQALITILKVAYSMERSAREDLFLTNAAQKKLLEGMQSLASWMIYYSTPRARQTDGARTALLQMSESYGLTLAKVEYAIRRALDIQTVAREHHLVLLDETLSYVLYIYLEESLGNLEENLDNSDWLAVA